MQVWKVFVCVCVCVCVCVHIIWVSFYNLTCTRCLMEDCQSWKLHAFHIWFPYLPAVIERSLSVTDSDSVKCRTHEPFMCISRQSPSEITLHSGYLWYAGSTFMTNSAAVQEIWHLVFSVILEKHIYLSSSITFNDSFNKSFLKGWTLISVTSSQSCVCVYRVAFASRQDRTGPLTHSLKRSGICQLLNYRPSTGFNEVERKKRGTLREVKKNLLNLFPALLSSAVYYKKSSVCRI